MMDTGAARNVGGKSFGQYVFGVAVSVLDDKAVYEYVIAFHKTPVLIETAGFDIADDDLYVI
jgi:hypothetical protein